MTWVQLLVGDLRPHKLCCVPPPPKKDGDLIPHTQVRRRKWEMLKCRHEHDHILEQLGNNKRRAGSEW